MDLFKPRGASAPRRPTDDKQENGQIVNPPRFARFGGLDKPSDVSKNRMGVQKPADGKKVI
jgi:hypothetical protein